MHVLSAALCCIKPRGPSQVGKAKRCRQSRAKTSIYRYMCIVKNRYSGREGHDSCSMAMAMVLLVMVVKVVVIY